MTANISSYTVSLKCEVVILTEISYMGVISLSCYITLLVLDVAVSVYMYMHASQCFIQNHDFWDGKVGDMMLLGVGK